MERASKGVAWLCMFSTLLMGCYSSVVMYPKIYPNGDGENGLSEAPIEYVVTKDGTKYDFVEPPEVHEGKIVGRASIEPRVKENAGPTDFGPAEVSIRKSDVAQAGMTSAGNITFVVMKSGGKYVFDQPASMVDNKIVGKGRYISSDRSDWEVSIPLADVVKVQKKSVDAGRIEYVVMRDGTEYEPYDSVIVNDTLVAEVWRYESFLPTLEQVKLPMSDVAKVSVSQYNPQLTLWTCVGIVVVLGAIAGAVAYSLDNMKLDFSR